MDEAERIAAEKAESEGDEVQEPLSFAVRPQFWRSTRLLAGQPDQ